MRRLLLIAPEQPPSPAATRLLSTLRSTGGTLSFEGARGGTSGASVEHIADVSRICSIFDGLPPDALIVDLSEGGNFLLLRHLHRTLHQVWGSGDAATGSPAVGALWTPPPILALLPLAVLHQPDWLAFADDFMLPPYTAEEVRARLRMIDFRRRHVVNSSLISAQDLVLDLHTRRAIGLSGETLPLTPREFELLQFLIVHRGKLWSRQRLLDLVWGVNFEGSPRTIDIHIRRLRAKLPPAAAAQLRTRHGSGYCFG